ncbi:MAG: hypothetical protein QW275_02430 [Candidatus Anstonellaceae archaeon]
MQQKKTSNEENGKNAFRGGGEFQKASLLTTEQILGKMRQMELENLKNGKTPNIVWETPLKHYADPLYTNFEEFLRLKARSKKAKGKELWVFDAGIGSGKQWLPLLSEMKDSIQLFGNALSKEYVIEELSGRVEACRSSKVNERFGNGIFDVAVSRYGMAFEELEAILSLSKLVVNGGHIIVVGDINNMPERNTLLATNDLLVLAESSNESSKAYWLMKR